MCDVYNIILCDARMYVCTYTYMYVDVYVYVCVYIYVCTYIVLHGQTIYDRYVFPHKQYGQ